MNKILPTPYQPPEVISGTVAPTMLQNAFSKCVVIRALYMAIIVGTILVMINHGMCVYSGYFNFTCFWQSALTYFVPYSVSTISSVLAMESHRKSAKANSECLKI